MIFADAGYFIAVLKPRDGIHARAKRWEAATASDRILTTEAVLVEVFNAMAGGTDRRKVVLLDRFLRTNRRHLLIQTDPDLLGRGIKRYAERPDQAWGLTDCVSFVVMEEHGVHQALAHDHHFEQAGFEALLRREPAGEDGGGR